MVATRVGAASTGGATTGTSFVTTNPQSPTANNTLILAISCNRANATYITLGGLSGWTLMGEGSGTSAGTQSAGVHIYAKIAAGGDTAPTITTSATSNLRWLMEEWSGLSTTLISTGIPTAGDIDLGSGALTLTQNRTSVLANEFQYGLQGGRGATTNPTVTWGGGLTADHNTSSGQVAMLKTSTGTIASAGGTMNATVDLTNNQGTPITGFVMVPFNLSGADGNANAVVATATAAGVAPVVTGIRNATVAAVAATATALAVVPAVSGAALVAPPTATATAAAIAPTVDGIQNATTAAVVATAVASAEAPIVDGGGGGAANVVAVAATADAAAIAPTVAGIQNGTVAPPAALATADGHAPTFAADGNITVVRATATALALPPTVDGIQNASVAAVTALATALGLPPVVSASASPTVLAVTATATATAYSPSVMGHVPLVPRDVIASITSGSSEADITDYGFKAVITT